MKEGDSQTPKFVDRWIALPQLIAMVQCGKTVDSAKRGALLSALEDVTKCAQLKKAPLPSPGQQKE